MKNLDFKAVVDGEHSASSSDLPPSKDLDVNALWFFKSVAELADDGCPTTNPLLANIAFCGPFSDDEFLGVLLLLATRNASSETFSRRCSLS